MDPSKKDEDWVHLLFRGGQSSHEGCDQDDYESEFSKRQLISATVPLLDFRFKNMDKLAELLEDHRDYDSCKGLIMTSPRVVEAIHEATKLIITRPMTIDGIKDSYWWGFKTDLFFALGERTLSAIDKNLNLLCNPEAHKCCNGRSLGKFIRKWLHEEHNNLTEGLPRGCYVNLIYPKSSLADDTIEKELANIPNLELTSIVVYETHVIKEIESKVIERLRETNILNGTSKLVINMIYFSPSGVNGFLQLDHDKFRKRIMELYPNRVVEFKYSSIGRTTEAALEKHGLDVFCVSDEPNPHSLVESIIKKQATRVQ